MRIFMAGFWGIIIGIIIGLIIVICVQSDSQLVTNKVIIDAGCGFYNSDKEFVLNDECKKYYQEVK